MFSDEIDKRKHLSLSNIMVLRIDSNNSYMITMLGLKQTNCEDRVLLCNGRKEMSIIEQCLQENIELEKNNISLDEAFADNSRNRMAHLIISKELIRCNSSIEVGNFRELVKGHLDSF